jgi:hypothetical protein
MQQAHFMRAWVSAELDGRYAVAMEDHIKATKLTERLNNTGVLAAYAVHGVPILPIDKQLDAASLLQPRLRLKQILADRRCAENPCRARNTVLPLPMSHWSCRRAGSSRCRGPVSPYRLRVGVPSLFLPCKLSLIEMYRRRSYFEILGLSEDKFVVQLYQLLAAKNKVQHWRRAVERAQADFKKHDKDDNMTDHVVVHLHPFDSRDECVKSRRYAVPSRCPPGV